MTTDHTTLDRAALRALATETIKINEANRPDNPYVIPLKVATFTPECVLALLDTADRHAALVEAVRTGNWDTAARLAKEG